ncbi:hypothetical protein ACLQ3L_10955 [Nocardia salmonicida]
MTGAVGSVVVAGTVNVATSILTESRSAGWIAFVVALLVTCVAVQLGTSEMTIVGTTVGGSVTTQSNTPGIHRVSDSVVGGDITLKQNGN